MFGEGLMDAANRAAVLLMEVCDLADWYVLDGIYMIGYVFDRHSDIEHHATVREVLAA